MKQVIHIQPDAPAKPAPGQPCNGCGVCCLAEPCPIGVLASRRWHGACAALVWSEQAGRYHCGLLAKALARRDRLVAAKVRGWRLWWSQAHAGWLMRMIAAGSGCDATLEVQSGDAPRA